MQIALAMENHCARRSVWHIEWCTKYRYMARTVGLDEEKAIWYVKNQQAHHGVEFL